MDGMIKIADVDLERVIIDFGLENGEKIYYRYLCDLTNRELGTALGYEVKKSGGHAAYTRKGRYRVSRFKMMCERLHIDPNEILSEYESTMFRRTDNCIKWAEVEEPLKNTIWKRICDLNDNKS